MARKSKHVVAEPVTPRSLPARGAKDTAIANLSNATNIEDSHVQEDKALADYIVDLSTSAAYQLQMPESSLVPVFTTFKTRTDLEEGLCIVRSLGGGKFELVNLRTVTESAISSEATAQLIANDSGLLQMFELVEEEWDKTKFKCQQATMAANGTIFRFFKLPIELRFKIYDLCLVGKSNLFMKNSVTPPRNSLLNLALLGTCHAVYNEGIRFFNKNTFAIYEDNNTLRSMCPKFSNNVQILSIEPRGFFTKDQVLFAFLASCTGLRVLKVVYTDHFARFNRHRTQHKFMATKDIDGFKRLTGHDILVELRGLDEIQIILDEYNPPNFITSNDQMHYQAFLMKEVTKPRPTLWERLHAIHREEMKKKLNGKGKNGKKGKFVGRISKDLSHDGDDEYTD